VWAKMKTFSSKVNACLNASAFSKAHSDISGTPPCQRQRNRPARP
jgi:hypothetical protein